VPRREHERRQMLTKIVFPLHIDVMKTTIGSKLPLFLAGIISAFLFLGPAVSPVFADTWGKTYHGPWGDWWTGTTVNNLIATSDGGFALVGTSNSHGVLVKLNSDGAIAWSKVFSPGLDNNPTELTGIIETADGGYAVTGQAYIDPARGGLGGWDAYVARLNASGTILWERLFGRLRGKGQEHPTSEYGRRIYENADGSFTVTGVVVFSHIGIDCPYHGYESGLILNISSGGALQSHYVVAGSYLGGPKNEVYKTNDGADIVGITHAFDYPLWYTLDLQRYSATGELVWTQGYYTNDGEANQWFSEHSIAEVADGYLVFVNVDNGRFQILQTDFDGNVAWQKRFKIYSDGTGAYPTQHGSGQRTDNL